MGADKANRDGACCEVSHSDTFTYESCTYHYQRRGKVENPPLLLLHGFMQSCSSWHAVANTLKAKYCVYALDFIGHGQSEKSSNPARYTYEDMAQSVDYFIRNICIPVWCDANESTQTLLQPLVHVIGYSMGGRIALQLLKTSSDVLASLILESCNVGCATEKDRQEAAQRNQSWIDRLQTYGMEAFVNYWETLPLFDTQRELGWDKRLHASRAANDAPCMVRCLAGSGKQAMPLSGDTLEVVRQVTGGVQNKSNAQKKETGGVPSTQNTEAFASPSAQNTETGALLSVQNTKSALPILYIYGAKDAKSCAVAQQLESVGASVSVINAGHNVHLEAPMLYLEEVQKFLAHR